MQKLKNTIEKLIDTSKYDEACELVKKSFNILYECKFLKNDFYFDKDKQTRDIYQCTLKTKRGIYSFKFGQSIRLSSSKTEPTLYDILACLIKYDPGTLEDFCSEFGYDIDSESAEKTYLTVKEEWKNIQTIWTDEEIELLQEIQ